VTEPAIVPEEADSIGGQGTLRLESIDFDCPVWELDARTHLAAIAPR
jgi:hypothetical protein